MHAFYILHCTLCFINYVVWVVAIVWFVCRGVICLLKVVDGSVVKGDRVIASSTGEVYDVLEVGSSSVPSPPPPLPALSLQWAEVYDGSLLFRNWLSSSLYLSSGMLTA